MVDGEQSRQVALVVAVGLLVAMVLVFAAGTYWKIQHRIVNPPMPGASVIVFSFS